MSQNFPQIHHRLRNDRGLTSTFALCAGLLFISLWLAWAFLARITRYEVSDSARLEVDTAPYPVQAHLSGRLIRSNLVLGKHIEAGDVLAELDTQTDELSLREERTHLAELGPQIQALRAELQAQSQGKTDERKVLALSQGGARAEFEEANAQATLAEEEWKRADRLRAEGILSVADAERARASALSNRAAAENLKAGLSRLEPELAVRERDREIKSKETQAALAKLEGELRTGAEALNRLEYEIERHRVRATVSGRLAECAALRPGSHINEGDKLGVILPSGKLQVIAEFQPAAALGRLHPSQPASLRLQGFPWAQYGAVPTRVARVADEIRDGKVRVELSVDSGFPSRIPPQHGLPGSVEVEVEQVSPAKLVLRSVGEIVGGR
jgi:multidrug resistance efflux pump